MLGIPASDPAGTVYVLTDDNTLQAIKPYSGTLIWSYRAGEPLSDVLFVGADFTVYLYTESRKLIAVTPGGTVRWKRQFNSPLSRSPAASPEGAVILPMEDGRLIKINGRGRVLWEKPAAYSYTSPVVDQDGSLYISGDNNTIFSYKPTGNGGWSYTLPARAEILALRSDYLLALTSERKAFCLDIRGNLIWENDTLPSGNPVSLLSSPDRIHIVYSSGMVIALNPDGSEESRFQGPPTEGFASIDSKGALYLFGRDRKLYRLMDDELIEIESDTPMTAPLLGAAANLFSGGENWIVYSYKTPASAQGWAGYRGGPLRNGAVDSGASLKRLQEYYEGYPGYLYFEMMSQSPELDKRLEIIDRFEKLQRDNQLIEKFPFAPLLLIDMAEEGISYASFDGSLVSNSSSLVRIKALNLLGDIGDIRTRRFIISHLYQEDSASAAVSAIWALAMIGFDYDGAATRAIASAKERFFNDDGVLLTICDTLEEIVYYNGIIPDQSGLHVLSSIYSSNAPYGIRKRAGEIFDNFTGGPRLK
ncbi:outer membrane protein assembly factor BamB [Spirochaeta isovalerica]|uniref:Outer membrane protein assembly factor BamB n=1 Tax=Spirochaeta isovalerica TaxID=150 RepID=A0A841R7W2_9SPIO|nr:outer membrane protein assembly factor BamB [Spirochaeta isovalerica]